jgi:hypothetical protein
MSEANLSRLVTAAIGAEHADAALAALAIPRDLPTAAAGVSRAEVAMALNAALFARLLAEVPTGARYVGEVTARGSRVVFDHGALRTIDADFLIAPGLPRGIAAFARLLEPLGYAPAGIYPLPRLRMTGHVFAHRDLPEAIPQFFVSELHLAELPAEVQAAAARVFAGSRDPLGDAGRALLAAMGRDGHCPIELACAGLPELVAAFGRQHDEPALADYEALLAASAEAAWIATEGNAFNHATDRVPDVIALAEDLRARNYPIKDAVEISASTRVRQTAFLADKVLRGFIGADGARLTREVPGSFYEFISRDINPASGTLDLRFDSGNATGIFAVTRA